MSTFVEKGHKVVRRLFSAPIAVVVSLFFFLIPLKIIQAQYVPFTFWKNDVVSIYRSVGAGNTSILACGTTGGSCTGQGNLTISGSIATFASAVPANIGVGDALVYDCNSNGTLGAGDCIAFVKSINSPTVYILQSANGNSATNYGAAAVWRFYRAYTSLANAADSTAGGTENSAIKAIDGTLGNFDSWSGGVNLQATHQQWNIALYADGPADTSSVNLQTWVTSTDYNLVIYTPYLPTQVQGSQRHVGSWNSSGYAMNVTGAAAITINGVNNVRIEGLKIQSANVPTSVDPITIENLGAIAAIYFDDNILRFSGNAWNTSQDFFGVFATNNSASLIYIYNNISFTDLTYSAGGERNCYFLGKGTVYIYDNTCYVPPVAGGGSTGGIDASAGTVVAKNNLMQQATAGDYLGTFAAGSNYNLSDDGTSTGGANDLTGKTVTFFYPAAYDYRLGGADTWAKGAGTNLSADGHLAFSTDIHNYTRASTWDIGPSMAPNPIYRSIGPWNNNAIACGKAAINGAPCNATLTENLSIAGSVATLSGTNMPTNIGVGDLIVYDCTNAGTLSSNSCIAFITGVTTAQKVYTLQSNTGGAATAFAASQVWQIYRAYSTVGNLSVANVNSGFVTYICGGNANLTLCNFENATTPGSTWTNNTITNNTQYNYALYADATDPDNATWWNGGGLNWTTDDEHYIKLYAPYLPTEVGVSQRHTGVWDPTKARIVYSGSQSAGSAGAIAGSSSAMNIWIDGLQIQITYTNSTSSNWFGIGTSASNGTASTGAYGRISNNIIVTNITDTGAGNSWQIVVMGSAAYAPLGENYVYNNIISNIGSTPATGIYLANGFAAVYNNTIINSGTYAGIDYCSSLGGASYGNMILKNNVVQGTGAGYGFHGCPGSAWAAGSDYNVSPDTSSTGGAHDSTSATVKFANPYFLNAADTVALNTGTNLSVDSNFQFNTDASGAARGATWSRGALGYEGWTWMAGSSIANGAGSYGTLGTAYAAPTHYPGPREIENATWTDSSGNFWLFGGAGYDSADSYKMLNDIWMYNSTANQWTWVAGSNVGSQVGSAGTRLTAYAAATHYPGARGTVAGATDASGNYWTMGGWGYANDGSEGNLGDLWKYNPAANQWTWVSGSGTSYTQTSAGAMGTAYASTTHYPGCRWGAAMWFDSSGNLWIFGGDGVGSDGNWADLNDVWKYNVSGDTWTWVAGQTAGTTTGSYGTKGTAYAAATHYPPGREYLMSWTDTSGNFWLFGGGTQNTAGPAFNDVWEYNSGTNQWTWVSGSSSTNQAGTFGTQGVGSTANIPAANQEGTAWVDKNSNVWLYLGHDYAGGTTTNYSNNLWRFEPSTQKWTWISGSTSNNQSGTYGVLGTKATGNTPGSRRYGDGWMDSTGNLWLLGGSGYDSAGTLGDTGDVWKFSY